MKAVLHQMAPGIPVIDLFADAPLGRRRLSIHVFGCCWSCRFSSRLGAQRIVVTPEKSHSCEIVRDVLLLLDDNPEKLSPVNAKKSDGR
jgi:hypothetical protein